MTTYKSFLEAKIRIARKSGFEIDKALLHPILKPHQAAIVPWMVSGGVRAVFARFGLGKSIMQMEALKQILAVYGGNVLIVCPLGVKKEFVIDGKMIGIDRIDYITDTSQIAVDNSWYITNYERVRMGSIDASKFIAVTMDEASVLRGLDTDTTQAALQHFADVKFKFVATAVPAPNRYLELINYAVYLGIMDRGQILTRFFKRDPKKAGNLKLNVRREKEFWYWVSSWAVFITKPSDLGFDDTGYILPGITINYHMVSYEREVNVDRRTGQSSFLPVLTKSLSSGAKEKNNSIEKRTDKLIELLAEDPDSNVLIWHHLEEERREIERRMVGKNCKSVFGSQTIDIKETILEEFKEGNLQYLSTKPEIAGSGCNLQYHCHRMIFLGINDKFNDIIQAIHRLYRFHQKHPVVVDIIYTDAEDPILKRMLEKWDNHLNMENQMTEIIREHGLNSDLYQQELKREFFAGRKEVKTDRWTAINNDAVEEYANRDDNSIPLIVSSIPFGNHYEYSGNYNCFGHNETNEEFFAQMDYLVPNLYRALMPGRIACIHVKDRIRYSYQNGTGFTSIEPFSDDTVACFRKHGFHLLSRITVDTDVVAENSQTYRLGWTEACKDMTKMGNGLPEYVLIFRKAPLDGSNAYADLPVVHEKDQYSRGRWQIDAHAHWGTSGERLIDSEWLRRANLGDVMEEWKRVNSDPAKGYDYEKHVWICEKLDEFKKLPPGYMVLPTQSRNEDIWDDISRINTLNAKQVKADLMKHICPLQLDIIERCIERYSNPGEEVHDPFGGIMSVPYQAVKMGRRGFATELNSEYWADGIRHLRSLDAQQAALSLF